MVEGSTLSLKDNCFIDNNFVGEGVAIVQRESDLLLAEGNYVSKDDNLQCPFVAVESASGVTCIGTIAEKCNIPGVETPSSALASQPLPLLVLTVLSAAVFCYV